MSMHFNFLRRRKSDVQLNELSDPGTGPLTKSSEVNPFLKIGDKIRLHSRHGEFYVLSINEIGFTVSEIRHGSVKGKLLECPWNDFRNWSKR